MRARTRMLGFTLIEMMTVIAIIMLLMALTLPNFVEMMRGRKWSASLGNIQLMVTRARSFAANARTDAAVEFAINLDNGTRMWVESEVNEIETMPDFSIYVANIRAGNTSGSSDYVFTGSVWRASGGHSDGTYHPEETQAASNGDNAHQTENMALGTGMTIDVTNNRSPHFESYDRPRPGCPYGKDDYPDVRVGQHGALVPTLEPTICLKEIGQEKRQAFQVIRCTGRLVRPK